MIMQIHKKHSSSRARPLRVLLIGSLPPPVGGTAISFQLLVNQLRDREDVICWIVNTAGIRGHIILGPFRLLAVFVRIFVLSFRANVISLHQVPTGLQYLGPFVLACAWLSRSPLVLRIFAGIDHMEMRPLKARIIHFVTLHANIYLAQTKRLVQLGKERGLSHIKWYPTSRPMPMDERPTLSDKTCCRRFVYIGHVREYKGIREMINASERLNEGITVDVYGPFFNDLEDNIFDNLKRVTYHGPLKPEDVLPTLRKYDMLLLPTKALTEGYPGIVLEGYSVGLPIIASNCGGIPEIVDKTSGILIEPGNTDELFNAMKMVSSNSQLYANLSSGVREKCNGFSSKLWGNRFVDICEELVDQNKNRSTLT